MSDLNAFIEMSSYAGGRFDLVQAGGGNTSVKTDDHRMYIKSSGYILSEISESKGYSLVDNLKVLDIFNVPILNSEITKREKDAIASKLIQGTIIEGERPSIETLLHSILYKYTSHVHSIAINVLTSNINWKEMLFKIDENALFIEYKTPGIELAFEMKSALEQYILVHGIKPNAVFLQNHGLIISSDRYEDVERIMEDIVKKAEDLIGLNLDRYKKTTIVARILNQCTSGRVTAYLSEDGYINQMVNQQKKAFFELPFCPDGLVYCGFCAAEIEPLDDEERILQYIKKFNESPKVVIYMNHVYIVAEDLKKAKFIEDVLKSNLMIIQECSEELSCLAEDELAYLGNWEAEKYRQSK